MNDIFDLYEELIIDHARSPRNFGMLPHKTHHARGHNPLCGDTIDLDMECRDGLITKIAFSGDGCAISKASASLMTENIVGKSEQQAYALFDDFHHMLTTEDMSTQSLGKLEALKGVRQFPMRVKCATLCWHTLNLALRAGNSTATTE